MSVLKNEPALVMGVVVAVLNLLVGLGLFDHTMAQYIYDVITSLVVLGGAFAVRQSVTPLK